MKEYIKPVLDVINIESEAAILDIASSVNVDVNQDSWLDGDYD